MQSWLGMLPSELEASLSYRPGGNSEKDFLNSSTVGPDGQVKHVEVAGVFLNAAVDAVKQ